MTESFSSRSRNWFRYSGVLEKLLIANISVFLIIRIVNSISRLFLRDYFSFADVTNLLAIPADPSEMLHRPWTLITYMFLHWDFFHLLFNMLFLYYMGSILQEFLGSQKLFSTYILGGMAGGLLYILCYNIFPFFTRDINSMALGASGSVVAILVAAATLLPDYGFPLFIFGTVRLKWIAAVIVLIDFIQLTYENGGGHIAHIGGAIFGFVYIRQLQKGRDLAGWFNRIFRSRGTSRMQVHVNSRRKKADENFNVDRKAKQEQMDEILDKISRSGYGSLTKAEKEFLFKTSKEN